MTGNDPLREQPFSTGDARPPLTWPEARQRLAEADTYWLATERPDGGPHLVPVLAVWVDGTLHFVASRTSQKARNLAHDGRCVIGASHDAVDLVVEGDTALVRDEATLRRVAAVYAAKYGWPVTVREGAFDAEGAPTAGPPPYDVYAITPDTVFGFGTEETHGATRWRWQER